MANTFSRDLRSLQNSLAEKANEAFSDPILLQKAAAELLGISVSTLTRWRSQKVGPEAFKLGSRVRYRLSALREFLNQSEQTPL